PSTSNYHPCLAPGSDMPQPRLEALLATICLWEAPGSASKSPQTRSRRLTGLSSRQRPRYV
ncbi:hypothetical protein C0995_008379, partial [Termitomyces sp. Mi166